MTFSIYFGLRGPKRCSVEDLIDTSVKRLRREGYHVPNFAYIKGTLINKNLFAEVERVQAAIDLSANYPIDGFVRKSRLDKCNWTEIKITLSVEVHGRKGLDAKNHSWEKEWIERVTINMEGLTDQILDAKHWYRAQNQTLQEVMPPVQMTRSVSY